jgi:dTDP-4-amino-4,6-dideoxygalactose transaminase
MSAKDLSEKQSDLDAVIAVHMFGNMCDMPRLRAAAPHTPFIEDCAQSLGSMLAGRIAGSFGDISVFSFRSGKYLSVGEGGALFSNRADVRSKALAFIAALPHPSLGDELLHVVKTFVKSILRRKPLYGMVGYRLWEGLNRKLNLSASSDVVLGKIRKTDLALVKARLPQLHPAIQAHRTNADSFSQNLTLAPGMLCSEPSDCFYNRLQYPIFFPSRACRDAIAAYLLEQGIDTIKYLDNIVALATTAYGYVATCPVSEHLSQRVLVIPNYRDLRQSDVRHITECLNRKWTQISNNGHMCDATSAPELNDACDDISRNGRIPTPEASGGNVETQRALP